MAFKLNRRKKRYADEESFSLRELSASVSGPVMFFLVIVAVIFVMSVFFRVSDIQVRGNSHYTDEEIIRAIDIEEGDDPLTAVAKHYLLKSQCARFMEQQEMRRRKQVLADYAKEYKADGIIVESNKFCEYWSFERMIDTIVIPRDYGYPVCSIEKEYINTASGQLRTRFQAFVESVELKKIQEGN